MSEVPVPLSLMEDKLRISLLDNQEQKGNREHLIIILQHMEEWRKACIAAGVTETTYTSLSSEVSKGEFDIIRQNDTIRIGHANTSVADKPNTDTYRMLLTFKDDTTSVSRRMFTLNHFTGFPFLQTPDTNVNILSETFHIQEFRQQDRPSNYCLEIRETVEGNNQSAVIYTIEDGELYISSEHSRELITNEHQQKLVELFDSVMPHANLNQPQNVANKKII